MAKKQRVSAKLQTKRKPVPKPVQVIEEDDESTEEECSGCNCGGEKDIVPAKKQKMSAQNDETDESESSDDDADEPEYDFDPKSFVLAQDNDESEEVSDDEDDSGAEQEKNKGDHRPKNTIVNKVKAMKERVQQMKKSDPWVNTVYVTADVELVFPKNISEDFDREAVFHKQATDGVAKAVAKLEAAKVPVARPEDYFAEMVKSDRHMQRIRKVLLLNQKEKERRENVRRIRNEKKFAGKVQKEVEVQKGAEKRKLADAVKKHKKGMKGQLESILSSTQNQNANSYQDEAPRGKKGGKKPKISRVARDKKFGFGGKISKRNDKASFDAIGSKPKALRRRNKKH